MITLTAKDVLPDDGASGTLVGRVWLPDAGRPGRRRGPQRRRVRRQRALSHRQRAVRGSQPGGSAARRKGRAHRRSRSHRRQHAARSPRHEKTLAARAGRPAGAESRRRHLCHLDAGARDRGAGAGQSGFRRSHPQGSGAAGRRRSFKTQARLGGGDEAEAGADRSKRLEPVSRSRHRSRRRSVHQGADDVVGRHGHGCRTASEIDLEQSGAGSRDCRVEPRQHRRRDARQRRQFARFRGTLGAAVVEGQGQQRLLRRRPAAAAVRQDVFRSTTSGRWMSG